MQMAEKRKSEILNEVAQGVKSSINMLYRSSEL